MMAAMKVGSVLQPLAPASDNEANRLLDQMAVAPLGYFERRTLLKAARRLGSDPLRRLCEAGVKIRIPDDPEAMRAAYHPSSKTLSIAPRRLDVSTVLHELGHALDDLAAPDEGEKPVLRSERDPRLQQLHQSYCRRVDELSWWQKFCSQTMWSDYARTSPQEYLAEGVMDFTRSPHHNQRLLRADPELHAYVQGLLVDVSA
ncbi:hypothetical protein DYH09_23970 [bacterium CPR1]|nr:hypothetical protein [bacterium CPR1]